MKALMTVEITMSLSLGHDIQSFERFIRSFQNFQNCGLLSGLLYGFNKQTNKEQNIYIGRRLLLGESK